MFWGFIPSLTASTLLLPAENRSTHYGLCSLHCGKNCNLHFSPSEVLVCFVTTFIYLLLPFLYERTFSLPSKEITAVWGFFISNMSLLQSFAHNLISFLQQTIMKI